MANATTGDKDFQRKLQSAEPMISNICDWLREQMLTRIANRSFGSQTLTLTWDDGNLLRVKTNDENVFIPKKNETLPLKGIDRKGTET